MTQIPFEQLSVLWEDGELRLRAAEPLRRRQMEHIIDAIVHQLRRRLGGSFRANELADLYLGGTDWCFELATKLVPGEPEAWDMSTLVGAAFSRYVRRASDYGGGRRWIDDEDA